MSWRLGYEKCRNFITSWLFCLLKGRSVILTRASHGGLNPPSRSRPMVYPPPYLKMKPLTSEKQPPPQFKIEATFQEMIPRKSAINSNLLKSLKNM